MAIEQVLAKLVSRENVVMVTAADFNGKSFDGAPLKLFGGIDKMPAWLLEAEQNESILVEARGSTDYAWFGVKDDYNNVIWAGPGDYILNLGEGGKVKLVVVPGIVMERFAEHF